MTCETSAACWGTALFTVAGIATVSAQNWPNRPVTMVVGFAAGGGTDVLGRVIARRLSEVLNQQVIVENVGGAGGMVGSARVVKATPDGYTIVLGSRADAINQSLYRHPQYDLRTDLMPVGLIADQPTVLIARPNIPVSGLQELIAYIKKDEDQIKFASAGAGSTGHLDCVRFNAAINAKVTHVPYRGGGPAMQDLIGDRVDYICTLTATAVPPIEGKLVKPIAIFTPNRVPMLPDLKTAKEQGFGDFEGLDLVRPHGAEGHTGGDHQAAARRDRRGHEHAVGAGAIAQDRFAGRAAGEPLDRLHEAIRAGRDRAQRRADPGDRRRDRVSYLPFSM